MSLKESYQYSEFFRITWNETSKKDQRYQLGQDFIDSIAGKLTVYSIDKTSYVENGSKYVRRYTVKVRNEKGDIFDWYSIEDPTNITLLSNFTKLVEV